MKNLRQLLPSPLESLAPEKVLEGLGEADAARRLQNSNQ